MPKHTPYTSPEHRQQILDTLPADVLLIGERNINLGPDGKPMTNELIVEDDPAQIAALRAQAEAMTAQVEPEPGA